MPEMKKSLVEQLYREFTEGNTRGILLYGPPGCGKTYAAKSLAEYTSERTGQKVSLLCAYMSNIFCQGPIRTARNIRKFFNDASKRSPSVLYVDEFDGLGGARRGRSVYADTVTNEFLADFDTIKDKDVIVIGATTSPWDVDPSFMGPDKIGRKILVGTPDLDTKAAYFEECFKRRKLAADVDFNRLAKITENYSFSDINSVSEHAGSIAFHASMAIKNPDRGIKQKDILKAVSSIDPEIYMWCCEAKRALRNPENTKDFPDIARLVDKTSSGRPKK
ncbi:MAG: ATP-binding protein [Candidatus Aenigmatarchaeota archaeon]